jgi:hypothetical protein
MWPVVHEHRNCNREYSAAQDHYPLVNLHALPSLFRGILA